MTNRRKQERRRWGRKVTYPFIDSDGVLVTKNRRRLVDRRLPNEEEDNQEATPEPKKKPAIVLSDTKIKELDDAISVKSNKKPAKPESKIQSSISDLESEILAATTPATEKKVALEESRANVANRKAKVKPKATPKPKPSKPKLPELEIEPLEKSNGISIELSYKNGDKQILSNKSASCQIGRDPSCDIVIQNKYVSRAHAKILFKDGKILLKDNSFNGTYIKFENGKKIHVSKDEQVLARSGVFNLGKPLKSDTPDVTFKIFQ